MSLASLVELVPVEAVTLEPALVSRETMAAEDPTTPVVVVGAVSLDSHPMRTTMTTSTRR